MTTSRRSYHVTTASASRNRRDTLFSSMYAAYETLSPKMKIFLANLDASHESEHVYQGRYSDRGVEDKTEYPSSIHPIVASHPISKDLLYMSTSFTTRLKVFRRRGQTLLELLFAHQSRPEFQVRFQWTVNAIALWDNRSAQHFAMWDYWPQPRQGHRVTIKEIRLKEAILINPAITRTCA